MSKFTTRLPVPLDEILKEVPKGTFVHSVTYDKDKSELVILWENEAFHSGFTVPVDFTPDDLRFRKLPAGVRRAGANVKEPERAPQQQQQHKPEPPPVKQPDYITTEEYYKAALKSKKSLEFWGIRGSWLPVTAEHTFTHGFKYRLIAPVEKPPKTSKPKPEEPPPIVPPDPEPEKPLDNPQPPAVEEP